MIHRSTFRLLLAACLCISTASGQDVELAEQGTVQADAPQPFAALGSALDARGSLAVAGAPGAPTGGPASGRVVLFQVVAGVWSQVAELSPDSGAAGPRFGAAVAIDGDTILVGDPDAGGSGAVYVFTSSGPEGGGPWSEEAVLSPVDGAQLDDFGAAVALSGNTALVGAPLDDDGGQRTGSAYVFSRAGGSWSQQAKLVAQSRAPDDRFGSAVDLQGNRALVGAPHPTFPNNFTGFAALFERQGMSWSQQAELRPSTGLAGDGFGAAVSLADDTALVGAPFHDARGSQAGAAYVYVRGDGSWPEAAVLLDAAAQPGDQAGSAVDLAQGVAFVGAPLHDGAAPDGGAVLVWQRVGADWEPRAPGAPSGAGAGDRAGSSVAATDQHLLLGAPGDDEPQDTGSLTAFLADVVLTQTFFDLGHGLPGFFGQGVLEGAGTLAPGSPVSLSLSNAQPVSTAFVFLGFTQADLPLRGGTLVPAPDILLKPIFLGLEGGFFLEGTWPAGLPTGFEAFLQAWWKDPGGPVNAAASNALQVVVP